MKLAAGALLAILLAGCATVWEHPAKGGEEYEADFSACEIAAAPQADAIMWRGMMERCLRTKGWRAR